MRFRKTNPGDLPQLKSLWALGFGDTEQEIEAFFAISYPTATGFCAEEDGKVIAANMWGKVKTVLQMLTIIFYYFGTALTWGNSVMIGADCVFLSYWLCWLVAIATAISGIKYLWDNRSFINTAK